MKLSIALAATLALGLFAAMPASAQNRPDQDRHDQGTRGDRDRHDMQGDRDRHDTRGDDGRGRHMGGRNHRHCTWMWRHHHRVRVCR